jgi:TonB family protein
MSDRLLTHLFDAKPARNRRDEAISTTASVLAHLLVLVLFISVGGGKSLETVLGAGVGDGIGAGPAGGGGGGGDDQPLMFTPIKDEPAAPSVEKPPEPVPPPVPVPEPEIKPVENPPTIAMAIPDTLLRTPVVAVGGSGGGQGTGTGSGTGQGTGPGSGGGSGGGEGGGIGSGVGPGSGRGKTLAPSPEVLLIPPPAPGGVRGKTVVVRLAVDENGTVRDAEVIPSTGDRKYDASLKRVAMGWRFRAARDAANKPVPVQFDVTFTF